MTDHTDPIALVRSFLNAETNRLEQWVTTNTPSPPETAHSGMLGNYLGGIRAALVELETNLKTPRLLTHDELHAMTLTADLANTLGRIVGDGPTRQADMHELVTSVHHIQHTVMSQAAARAYPERFRLLGQTIS